MCFKTTSLGKLKHGNNQGCLFKNSKNDNPSSVTVVLQRPDSVPYLLVLFSFFQKSFGSAVGILAAAVHLCLEGWCIFHCMVQYVVSLMEQKCFYQTVCHCSALGKIVSRRTEESSEIK